VATMTTVKIPRPRQEDFAPYYGRYIALVPDGDVIDGLVSHGQETVAMLRRVDEQRSLFRYAEGKWSIREIVGHVTDAERVFSYRALSFARADATALPGFDEGIWAAASNAHGRPLDDLIMELTAVRMATLALIRGFGDAEITRTGTASGNPFTVASLVYIIAGHERHHVTVLRERYGLQ
jgi:hypothetical protein